MLPGGLCASVHRDTDGLTQRKSIHMYQRLCNGWKSWTGSVSESAEGAERSYVGELAHSIGFDSDVVLLELLFDLIDAGGDVLGLRADRQKGKQKAHQIKWSDIQTGKSLATNTHMLINLFNTAASLTGDQ